MEQMQLPLLWFMLAAYLGAFMFYAFSFWARNAKIRSLAQKFVYVGLFLNTAVVLLRSVLIGGLPLNNGFEFGLSFVFAAAVVFVFIYTIKSTLLRALFYLLLNMQWQLQKIPQRNHTQ